MRLACGVSFYDSFCNKSLVSITVRLKFSFNRFAYSLRSLPGGPSRKIRLTIMIKLVFVICFTYPMVVITYQWESQVAFRVCWQWAVSKDSKRAPLLNGFRDTSWSSLSVQISKLYPFFKICILNLYFKIYFTSSTILYCSLKYAI